MPKMIKLLPALIAALCIHSAAADDRALIVGVGEYQISSANLDGIDIDIEAMTEVAEMIGFSNIKTLRDSEATLDNVTQAMRGWLAGGVSESDRVMIYFSGHGARIPDQDGDERDDGQDEVLAMHDLEPTMINGKKSLKGVLVDDDFNDILQSIPSENILVLIDACHSGTATKGLRLSPRAYGINVRGQEKFFRYGGGSSGKYTKGMTARSFTVEGKTKSADFISISAAGDDERAIATEAGSIFTQGVLQTVQQAYRSKDSLTPTSLHRSTHAYVSDKMSGSGREFYPVLTPKGSALASKPIRVTSTSSDTGSDHGPRWRKIIEAMQKVTPLKITLNQQSFSDGDPLEISIDIPEKGGYLNVVNIGPTDAATVLYPNQYDQDNRVSGGKLTIPTPNMDFELPASAPYGDSLVAAFVSKKPINLYESGSGPRDGKGDLKAVFAELSAKGTRSFQVAAKQRSAINGGYVVTRVEP